MENDKRIYSRGYRKLWSENCCYRVTYNLKARRIWGSNICMTIWVTSLILLLITGLTVYFGMIYQMMKPSLTSLIAPYLILILLFNGSALASLYYLFKTSMTDPGFLPGSNHFGAAL